VGRQHRLRNWHHSEAEGYQAPRLLGGAECLPQTQFNSLMGLVFDPERGAHDALRRIAEVITNGRTQWVVEVDIPV